jgi:hypothetical protein
LPIVLLQVDYFKGVDWPIQAYRANLFFPGGGDVNDRGCGRGLSGGNPTRLAVEFGVDGDGDVSDGSHGHALLKNFALLAVCAMEGK